MKSDALKDEHGGAGQVGRAVQLTLAQYPHRNQQLFSDHYLNVILPGREDWRVLGVEAEQVFYDL